MKINLKVYKIKKKYKGDIIRFVSGFMALNATFNNISVILRQSVLLVEETGVPGENK
jgi:hypothetical protein